MRAMDSSTVAYGSQARGMEKIWIDWSLLSHLHKKTRHGVAEETKG